MNHVAKLTEYFLKKEQDISLNMMITYNIAFNFMSYLDFPIMRNFFIFLIGNMYHYGYFNIKNQIRLWKYFSVTGFFIDFANLMLYPSFDQFPLEKTKEKWHPYDVTLFMITKDLKSERTFDNKKEDSDDMRVPLFEEYTGFRTDIDRMKSSIHGKKTYLVARVVKQVNLLSKLKSLEVDKLPTNLDETTENQKRMKTLPEMEFASEKIMQSKRQSIRMSTWKKQQISEFNTMESEKNSSKNDHNSPKRLFTFPSPIQNNSESKEFFMKSEKKIREKGKFKSMAFTPEFKNKIGFNQNLEFQLNNTGKKILPPLPSNMTSQDLKNHHMSIDFKHMKTIKASSSSIEKSYIIRSQTKNLKRIVENNQRNKFLELAKQQQPYITEVIEESKLKVVIKELYPPSSHYMKENEIDRKAKEINFSNEKIVENDYYALHLAEILSIIIKNAIENYTNHNLKEKIEYVQKNYAALFNSMFAIENGRFLELLFEVLKTYSTKFYI